MGPSSIYILALFSLPLALSAPSSSVPSCCTDANGGWDCSGCTTLTDGSLSTLAARQDGAPGPLTLYPPKAAGGAVNCGATYINNYDMGLHVASIFIILVTSLVGVMFPIVAGWWAHARGTTTTILEELDAASFGNGIGFWPSTFFLARHFGTGIIFSTTFIHLLDEGIAMFNDPCIGKMHFNATAPAIALAATFLTFYLDFIGSRAAADLAARAAERTDKCENEDFGNAEQQAWQVVLLEAGIIFHSVMVGVTLGAGSGYGWTTLMIVIVFHQIFEGAALGARIAVLHWLSRTRAFMYGMAFTLVTPIAMALGIGIRASLSQNGRSALLAVGILDSLSAGILLYTSFKLLNSDFVEGPLRTAPVSRVLLASAMMMLGCFLMSLLGKWA